MSQYLCTLGKRRAIFCMLVLLLTGCGPGRGDVAGKVTYQGKPVIFGSVQFTGNDNRPQLAEIDKDGTYSLKGVAAGANQVLVHSPNPRLVVRINKRGEPIEEPPVDPKLWFQLPDKYSDPQQADLTFTVESGKTNTINIDLK